MCFARKSSQDVFRICSLTSFLTCRTNSYAFQQKNCSLMLIGASVIHITICSRVSFSVSIKKCVPTPWSGQLDNLDRLHVAEILVHNRCRKPRLTSTASGNPRKGPDASNTPRHHPHGRSPCLDRDPPGSVVLLQDSSGLVDLGARWYCKEQVMLPQTKRLL